MTKSANETINILGDIRDACGVSTDIIITRLGKIYVMPEIGIIQMENICRVTTTNGYKEIQYIYTLNNTNI